MNPHPRPCSSCGGVQTVHIRLVPAPMRQWRKFGWQMIIRGQVVRYWWCSECRDAEDTTRWPEPAEPPRPDIVLAIKRLRAAGWHLHPWEK